MLGPYEIIGLIGAGGMGEVYRAHDPRLGRNVALKVIRSGGLPDADATRRLMVEARTAASISHPNIAQVFDIGEREGRSYVVMELIEGVSLEERLVTGPLPIDEAVQIARGLAAALAEAHRRGVIHRDIKPANVLITPGGQVKVLDFGIAKLIPHMAGPGSSVSSTDVVIGTPQYMSPEQALGQTITPATDVFSAGVVMYRMVEGGLPFKGDSVFQTIDRILHADPPRISRSGLPGEFARVISRALEKNAEARYSDGAALEQALAAAASAHAPDAKRVMIAVLPFDDLSPDRDSEYFSNGLAEEITVALSGVDSLNIVSRSVTSRYNASPGGVRSIATELGVDFLLEGSVRKVGDALRITVQLIDARTSASAWVAAYKGTIQNVFEIQEEVARKIVDALTLKLTPAERVTLGKRSTLDAVAFDLYLKGRHYLDIGTRADLEKAMSLFKAALARDSRYAAAHAGVAATSAAFYEYYDRDEGWLDKSVESALRALMYDPALSEAYAALALAYFNKGSVDDSRAACQRAIEIDPENWIGYWTLGRIHYVTGRMDEAIVALRRVISLNPDFYIGYFTLRMVCQASGKEEIYRPYLMRLISEVFPAYLERNPDDARARNSYGMELSMAGRVAEGRVEAQRAVEQAPGDPMVLYATACYEATFGERNQAVSFLERAIDAGFVNLRYMSQDPDLRPLHDDPAYQDLLRRTAFPRVTP